MALISEKNVRMARILPVSIYEEVIGLDRDKFVDCCKLNFLFLNYLHPQAKLCYSVEL